MFLFFYIFKKNDIIQEDLKKLKPFEQKEIHNNPIIINEQIEKTKNINIIKKEKNVGQNKLQSKEANKKIDNKNNNNNQKQNKLPAKESIYKKGSDKRQKFSFPPIKKLKMRSNSKTISDNTNKKIVINKFNNSSLKSIYPIKKIMKLIMVNYLLKLRII